MGEEDDFRELTVHGIPPTTPLSDVIIFFNKVIFSTRFECGFTSSSLETSVILRLYTRNECKFSSYVIKIFFQLTLVILSSVVGCQVKMVKILHSERVENIQKYTRNEWRTYKNTLGTSGEDTKIHSERV